MNIALCYESVLPARGGAATYITDLSSRLVADRHEVHLYACRWDADTLPAAVHCHALPASKGPRFLRPWRFAARCLEALQQTNHHVSVGFDKTWGQDVLYPQGGLHAASADCNLRKYANPAMRILARVLKAVDLAHWSYSLLEKRQYLGAERPLVVVNSQMVQQHFLHYYGLPPSESRVVYSSIDPGRFSEHDRPRRRSEWRELWGIEPTATVGLFVAMNYRLKGMEPLLHAVRQLRGESSFRLLVAGHSSTGKYERMARRLGIASQVRFIGHCADMRNAYFAADFLVHPTFYDPCSLVALEAMACGLPVVTTRCNGASELMNPPAEGFVIDHPHQVEELAQSMAKLLDSGRRLACGQAARRAAQQWTFENHYQQLLQVFKEAAVRKRAA